MRRNVGVEPDTAPAPRLLTANTKNKSLYEHFLAFLNANNTSGFQLDELTSVGERTIGDLMLEVATASRIAEEDFKRQAKTIKKTSDGHLTHSRSLELLAVVFGYQNYNVVAAFFKRDGMLQNRRNPRGINMKLFTLDKIKDSLNEQ